MLVDTKDFFICVFRYFYLIISTDKEIKFFFVEFNIFNFAFFVKVNAVNSIIAIKRIYSFYKYKTAITVLVESHNLKDCDPGRITTSPGQVNITFVQQS